MSNAVMSPAAEEIAQLLKQIRDAEREKVVVQNKLDELSEKQTSLKEHLNKLESQIKSTKYAITDRVNDAVRLSLITDNGE